MEKRRRGEIPCLVACVRPQLTAIIANSLREFGLRMVLTSNMTDAIMKAERERPEVFIVDVELFVVYAGFSSAHQITDSYVGLE